MSSEKQIRPSGRFYVSPEECREMFNGGNVNFADADIPEWHKELLQERIADYCKNGFEATPLEEFERELFEMLRKG